MEHVVLSNKTHHCPRNGSRTRNWQSTAGPHDHPEQVGELNYLKSSIVRVDRNTSSKPELSPNANGYRVYEVSLPLLFKPISKSVKHATPLDNLPLSVDRAVTTWRRVPVSSVRRGVHDHLRYDRLPSPCCSQVEERLMVRKGPVVVRMKLRGDIEPVQNGTNHGRCMKRYVESA